MPIAFPSRGFTLLELLFTLALLVLLSSLAVPAMSHTLKRANNRTLANQMIGLIQYARSESVVRRQVITLCGSRQGQQCDGDWSSHVLVLVDHNRNGKRDDPDTLLQVVSAVKSGESLRWRVFGNKAYLQLHPDGRTRYQNGNFTYCPANGDARYALHWLLNASGRLRLAPDKNGNGIPENSSGKDISCL
jgi:type IV fimbrial biogenesis protein FimT